jgi:hypothetical protein
VRYGEFGRERPALIAADDTQRDLSRVVNDITGPVLTAQGLQTSPWLSTQINAGM